MKQDLATAQWPKRLWAPVVVSFTATLRPGELVARLSDAATGGEAARGNNVGKVGYRLEETSYGFKLFKVSRFLWYPPRPTAVFDAIATDAGAGTLVEGEIRMPYPSVIMFCIFWVATAAAALLPGWMVVAALILWGGFGTLFTLAVRADVVRSAPLMVEWFEATVSTPIQGTNAEDHARAAPPPTSDQPSALFPRRRQALVFLAGLAGFWGGFLVIAILLRSGDPRLGRNAQAGPVEIAAFALVVAGGVLLAITTWALERRLTERTVPKLTTQLRLIMPSTLADAGRVLGLPGPAVAGVLYVVLIVGMISFFSTFLLR